ncbi:MAG: DivIVA domain-containing protein [Oscillospiraceae bacterium]|nr:DivIVA domain-containing protein [Oscillospiraceae bacterium]
MLTPQEVSERSFAKASFGGYNMGMVDDFLDVLTADYTALYNENAVLKSKMKVLVDKVEEYRSTEEAMRKALLTAQRIADEMVSDAESKKKAMLDQVEEDAAARMEELKKQEADQLARLEAAKAATSQYVATLKRELSKEVDFISGLEEISAPEKKPDPVLSAAFDIERTMQDLVRKEAEPKVQEPEDSSAATQVFAPVTVDVSARREEEPAALFDYEKDGEDAERERTVEGPEEDEEPPVEEPTRRDRFDLDDLASHFGAGFEP